MPKVNFNVHAYTARLIGRENVSKLEGAILELVKNTYDADASHCILYYEDSTKTLYIADNGHGMTKEIIEEHWMTIGNSSKVRNYKSKKGRIQTGAKGIGRFALDRISDGCKMYTATSNSKIEWRVNWSDFDSGNRITEIYADLDEVNYDIINFLYGIKNQQLKELVLNEFENTGTIFKLSELREEWSLALVDKIKNNLATLIPPEIENIFKVYFFTENTSTEEARVTMNDGLFSYDYKLQFDADSNGNVEIKIHRDEFEFDNLEKIIKEAGFSSKDKEYFLGVPIVYNKTLHELMPNKNNHFIDNIGAFSGVLYFSKLSVTKFEKEKYYYKDFSGRRDYKETFGGIKMYRDNFRIRPYGEPKTSNYDWLLLSNRKAKSPAAIASNGQWRVNSDQMLGAVFISRTNIYLPDQANREGIVETPEFRNFREILLGIIKLFEEDRQYVMRILNKYYEETHFTAQYEEEIYTKASHDEKNKKKVYNDDIASDKQANKNNQYSPHLIEASKAKTVIQNKESIIRDLEDENRLLRALATTGIVTNTYIHEIKDSTHKLSMKIVMAKEALELDDDKNEAIEYINEASQIKNSFNSWFKVTIESVRRDKRTMKEIDLQHLLQGLVSSWNDVASNKGIRVNLSIDEIKFKCFPYELEILFNNLITNSITSFDSISVENKEINIKVYQSDSSIIIDYSDTGAGLSKGYKNNPREILKPHETDKFNELGEKIGTGMGMWIIDKTVSEYNGEVDLTQNISSQTGFYIKITLKGKVKTL